MSAPRLKAESRAYFRALGKHITGAYQSRTKEYCAGNDPICVKGGIDVLAHLSYFLNADDAATFIAGKI